ncbi:hypothetical protein BV998_24020 [Salmonella enterica]|nr:hypothetical protein [Salmonella enterica]EBH4418399.1 hypothetical protein [Salmonella enterica]
MMPVRAWKATLSNLNRATLPESPKPSRLREVLFLYVRLTYRIEPQVEMVSGERNNNPLKFVVTSYVRDKEARG